MSAADILSEDGIHNQNLSRNQVCTQLVRTSCVGTYMEPLESLSHYETAP